MYAFLITGSALTSSSWANRPSICLAIHIHASACSWLSIHAILSPLLPKSVRSLTLSRRGISPRVGLVSLVTLRCNRWGLRCNRWGHRWGVWGCRPGQIAPTQGVHRQVLPLLAPVNPVLLGLLGHLVTSTTPVPTLPGRAPRLLQGGVPPTPGNRSPRSCDFLLPSFAPVPCTLPRPAALFCTMLSHHSATSLRL